MSAVYANFRGQGDNATLGLNVVLSILIGFGGGHWLDGRLGSEPLLALVGFGCGLLAAGRFVYRAARRMKDATLKDGFEESSTDRPARFKMDEGARKRKGRYGRG